MKKNILSLFFYGFLSLFLTTTNIQNVYGISSTKGKDFTLTSATGEKVSLSDYAGKIVVLEWFNPSCPFVKKHYNNTDMQGLQKQMVDKGVVWLSINSTNKEHSNYLSAKQSQDYAKESKMASTHWLIDEDGKVGKMYGAKTTPHMFIINKSGEIAYQGAIDDKSSAYAKPSEANNYVKIALDALLEGKPVLQAKTAPYGCSVKYK